MTAAAVREGERGQILPMMALLMAVLMAMVGLAIDVGRIMVAKAELVRAVDSAALAGTLMLPDLDLAEQEVYIYMAENEPAANVDVVGSSQERRVEVEASRTVSFLFVDVLNVMPGIDVVPDVTVNARAVAGFGVLPLDVYTAIDATGSMGASPCNSAQNNSGCPIKEAKDAAHLFVDTLLDDSSGASDTQVGVGPFRGCYRPPRNYSRCVPVGQMVADLTSNKGLLNGKIQDINSRGGTGTNLCWGMLKGQEILFGANGQTASSTLKILVLLSDGDNTYNKRSYSSSQNSPPPECRPWTSPWRSDKYVGSACRSAQTRERQLDILTRDMAEELKSQGVEIYVVGFGPCGSPNDNLCSNGMIGGGAHDNTADRNLLKCSASSSQGTNDHYFEVPTATDLPDVFEQIARQLAFRLIE